MNSIKEQKSIKKTITRRAFLFASATSLTLMGCSTVSTTVKKPLKIVPKPSGKTFLLIHGAWHGGWCWRYVRKGLEALGHKVITPTLTGLGERKHLLSSDINLSIHVQDVLNVIQYEGLNEFVLVGHSYGGMVITGVADAVGEKVSHMVYLDAVVPENGQSMLTLGPNKTDDEIAQTKASVRRLSADGIAMGVLPPDIFSVPKEHPNYSWLAENLTPHPLKSWFEPIYLKGSSEELKRTYIHCVNPPLPQSSFAHFAAIAKQNPTHWNHYELQTGHDAMITMPDKVVEILNITA